MRRALLLFGLLLGACASGTADVDDPQAPDLVGPPPVAGWTCAASKYDAGDGCDCECGAPDPDCEVPEGARSDWASTGMP